MVIVGAVDLTVLDTAIFRGVKQSAATTATFIKSVIAKCKNASIKSGAFLVY